MFRTEVEIESIPLDSLSTVSDWVDAVRSRSNYETFFIANVYFRGLGNSGIIVDAFPLLEELLSFLKCAERHSRIELGEGYHLLIGYTPESPVGSVRCTLVRGNHEDDYIEIGYEDYTGLLLLILDISHFVGAIVQAMDEFGVDANLLISKYGNAS